MTDFDKRRRKLLQAGGAALTFGLAGCVGPFADGQGVPGTVGESPDGHPRNKDPGGGDGSVVDQYLSDANGYESVEDMTGMDEVTVEVGAGQGLAFGPAAIQVDPGTTITWEWTGQGGSHNVVDEDGAFESELVSEAGHTFSYTVEEERVFRYFCQPHKGVGMKGAVVVGDAGGGGGGGAPAAVEDYLSDANGYEGVEDMTGMDEVTVEVGTGQGLAFGPAAVRVDPGTTVVWEWTGQGGGHNVVDEDEKFNSGELVSEQGYTFEYTFEEEGVTQYFCQPHKGVGMKGAVVVGEVGGGSGGGGAPAAVEEYLSDAPNYDGVADMTGMDEVTVEVGVGQGLAFGPAAIRVDPGTTVVWEWTGQGGAHNVVDEDEKFNSGELVSEQGYTFEYTFEEEGVTQYFCSPHKGVGMKGAVVVGGSSGSSDDGGGGSDSGGGMSSDVESYLSDANGYESVEDMTGMDEVAVDVGAGQGLAFGPAAIRVDPGTTVVWEWTGQGGQHNVVDEDGAFESELVGEQGHTFEYSFEESGGTRYFCQPHKGVGMKGAVIVE